MVNLTALLVRVSQTTVCLGNIVVIRAFVYGYAYHTHESVNKLGARFDSVTLMLKNSKAFFRNIALISNSMS